MEDKIKEIMMELIYKRFEQRLAFWSRVELENFIEISAQEIVKLFAIPDVSGSLPSNNLPKDDYRNDTHDQNGKEIPFWQ